jgi:hypothetical protein
MFLNGFCTTLLKNPEKEGCWLNKTAARSGSDTPIQGFLYLLGSAVSLKFGSPALF